MKKSKPYAELVTQAEEATKAIKDPELRRVAFERVLDDLLVGSPGASPRELPQGKTAKSKGGGSAAKPVEKSKKNVGPKAYIKELLRDGFFEKPKTIAEVKAELANHGHHIPLTSLSGPLQSLCKERFLRRHKAKSEKGKKAAYNYSEW